MFLKPCYRTKNGKRHAYWALVESYRTARGPRHRVVAYLGQAAEPRRRGVKRAAGGCAQPSLFDETEAEWVEVDVKRLRVERCLDFGGPWLGLQLLRKLERIDFLEEIMPAGREQIPWPLMATVLVLCRLSQPSSELHIAEHLYQHTAIADLLGIPPEKINEQRLYRALDKLLVHKDALQIFLKNQLGNLFDLEYDLLLYDMTSTYFEGEAKANPKAQRGYSRDRRADCKQICVALVVTIAKRLGKLLGRNSRAAGLFETDVVKGPLDGAWLVWRKVPSWRRWAELGRIKLVDVVLPTRDGTEIRRRCVTRPDDHQAILLQRLKLNLPSGLPVTDKEPGRM